TMIVRALEVDTYDLPEEATFKDVPTDHWAFKYVEAAHRDGIVNGISANEFGVNLESTREQMAAMFTRALGTEDSAVKEEMPHFKGLVDKELVSEWAIEEVEMALATGLMQGVGDNRFAPQGAAKREQVAVITHRFLQQNEKSIAYPQLFNTLKKYARLPYNGEIHTNLTLSFEDLLEEEELVIETEEHSFVNGTSLHSKGQMKMLGLDEEDMVQDYEMLIIGNKLYILDHEENMWILFENEEVILKDGDIEGYIIGRELYKNYHNLTIDHIGEVEVNNEVTSKYIIEFTHNEILSLIPNESLEMLEIFMGDLYSDELKYTFELYINENQEILQLNYIFEGLIEEEGEMSEIKIYLQLNFHNIGGVIEIQEPDASQVIVFDWDDFDFDFDFGDFDWDDFDWDDIDWDDFDFDDIE
ncbi:MAG: S-layer homology domain-containing protein, partial [Clostridiaceae bacterium]|nr:S-layer homology domain-containing protein [Clostridiaceae bacterium]